MQLNLIQYSLDRYVDIRRLTMLHRVGNSLSNEKFDLMNNFVRKYCILWRDRQPNRAIPLAFQFLDFALDNIAHFYLLLRGQKVTPIGECPNTSLLAQNQSSNPINL